MVMPYSPVNVLKPLTCIFSGGIVLCDFYVDETVNGSPSVHVRCGD